MAERAFRIVAPITAITCLVVVVALLAAIPARAAQVLENPGFEDGSTHWVTSGQPDEMGYEGNALRFDAPAGEVLRQQWLPADGATFAAEIYAMADVEAPFDLVVEFIDGGFVPLGKAQQRYWPGSTYGRAQLGGDVPPGAQFVAFVVVAVGAGSGSLWLDSASLEFAGEPPTATPTSTSTPTPTATPSSTATPTASSTANDPGATATPPRTPTRTPSATTTTGPGQPPGNASPTPTRTPKPTPPPKPPSSGSASSPGVVVVPGGPGGLLANGGFEILDGEAPAGWRNFGGDLYTSPNARSGLYAGSLLSQTASTKWIYQAVPVTPGRWYAFDAWARRESGHGELFLRLSWYASSDGSGTTLEQVDSLATTSALDWTYLETGPVKAPPAAHSVRVRLMVRPNGPVSGAFDDARFVEVEAPAVAPQPTPTATTPRATPTPMRTSPTATTSGGGSGGNIRGPLVPFAGAVAGATTLRINEVMSDPTGEPDNAHEWVELFNTGSEAIDLAGWTIEDAVDGDRLPELVIPPGGFALVVAGEFVIPDGVAAIRVPDGRIGRGLNNGGDLIRLRDPSGALVDEMSYGDNQEAFAEPPAAPGAGETIGRNEGDGASAWAQTLRPTPGEPNEFPALPTAAAPTTPSPGPTADRSPDDSGEAENEPEPAPIEPRDPGGGSPVPWLLVGAAAGAGLLATSARLWRLAPWRKAADDR